MSLKERRPALDGVRGIAILVVLVHNLSVFRGGSCLTDRIWMGIVGAGWIGVQLFFVLSGFLITRILLDTERRAGTFYARRALRIVPLYVLLLAAHAVVARRPFGEMVWYWLFLSNWSVLAYGIPTGLGHLWSLAVEEQFYLVWPWLAWHTSGRAFAWTCVALVVVSFAARAAFRSRGLDPTWSYMTTVTRMDALAIGALVAAGLRSETWGPRLVRALDLVFALSILGLLVVMAKTHGLERTNPIVQVYGYLLLSLGGGALVTWAALPTAPRLLSWAPLRFFGKYSYAIYLFHVPLKPVVLAVSRARVDALLDANEVLADAGFIVVLTAATLVCALISWRVVERPALAWKDRVAPRPTL